MEEIVYLTRDKSDLQAWKRLKTNQREKKKRDKQRGKKKCNKMT